MVYTAVGQIADQYFLAIPEHTKANCTIDTHQIMPNHAHGIIAIREPVETLHCNVSTTSDPQMSAISPKAGSLSAMVRSYKSAGRFLLIAPNMAWILVGNLAFMTALSAMNVN
ncbi:MAG: hypothetical protein R3D55_23045 [Chloroflexota bacterium]